MTLIFLFLLLSLLYLLPKLIKVRSRFSPPGPRGLPFIGNLHQIDQLNLHTSLWNLSKSYGPVVSLKFGFIPAIVVSSASLAKEVMKTQDRIFCSRPSLIGQQKVSYNGLELIFSPYNEYWKEMRKVFMIHLLGNKRVQSFRYIREDEVSRTMKIIQELALSSKQVNLSEIMKSVTSTIIMRVGFGKRYQDGDERKEVIDELLEVQAMMADFFVSDLWPGFPFTGLVDRLLGKTARLEKCFQYFDVFYQKHIDEHLNRINPKPNEEEDFIDILLRLKKDKLFDLTYDHIKALIMPEMSPTEKKDNDDDVKGGELLFCGLKHWDPINLRRNQLPESYKLVSPTRLRPLVGVDIRFVASGSASYHCVALGVDGSCYTWGRNEKGQLGHGDKNTRNSPTIVSGLSKYKVVKAGNGGGHTVVLTEDGISMSFGWNKHGQLGTGSTKNEFEMSPVQCLVSDVRDVACGTDFTVWLTSTEGASILTAGHPQYGQLGHGTDNEYNTKESSVRLAYEAQPKPTAIASLSDETIVKVACGSNHTVALDSNGYLYTWGFGGYGRLGHHEQKDEWTPRRVDIFTKHSILPPAAIISAGSASSACTAGAGKMYMWGQIKIKGDSWMYPKPLMDLSGWNIRCMDSGGMHYFVGAESSCISWGSAVAGELGYGPNQQKSSAKPKKVDVLEGMHVISVACGLAHSLVVVDRSDSGDQLDQLDVYDCKDSGEEHANVKKMAKKSAAKASENTKRKKKPEESSEPEVEEESNDEGNNDSDLEGTNGSGRKKQRGCKTSTRGRPSAARKVKAPAKRGRGRPKRS